MKGKINLFHLLNPVGLISANCENHIIINSHKSMIEEYLHNLFDNEPESCFIVVNNCPNINAQLNNYLNHINQNPRMFFYITREIDKTFSITPISFEPHSYNMFFIPELYELIKNFTEEFNQYSILNKKQQKRTKLWITTMN